MHLKIFFQNLIAFTLILALLIGMTSPTISAQVNVAAGGEKMLENGTSPLTAFVPRDIQISAGETVTWTNPTPVSEPHTITFFSNGTFFAPPLLHLRFQIQQNLLLLFKARTLNQQSYQVTLVATIMQLRQF